MAHTHELTTDGAVVTKRYTSWQDGEHQREWAALNHVHRHRPDLVPRPLTADLDAQPPVITMSLLPGEPLDGPLSATQAEALATALTALWTVPLDGASALGPRREDLGFARRLTDGPRPSGSATAQAYDAAQAWWDGPDPVLLRNPPPATVLGHGDPNLANYLWDGSRVRIVDLENAAVSDPAGELAIFAEHLGTRGVDVDAFCARFDIDGERLLAARRLWAMYWLWMLLPGGPAARRNPPGTADLQARRLLEVLGR